jgi:hypothetical protein
MPGNLFARRVDGGGPMKDPIVEEIRRYRMEHTRKFGGDLNLICEDLRRIQRESGCQVVRRPPKLLAAGGGSKVETQDGPRG